LPLKEAVNVSLLLVMVKLPVREPEAVGAKTIATVQPVFAGSVAVHVFAEILKSPVAAGVPRFTGAPPVFEIVMFCAALVALTIVVGKLVVTGVSTTVPAAVAVPLNATVACPPATFPKIVIVALRPPVATGMKRTCTVHLWLTATAEPMQSSVSANSLCGPSGICVWLIATWLIISGALPVFVTVTLCGALAVATAWLAKMSDVGDTEISGCAGVAAVRSGICHTPRP
jgi:hypothetical protein